MADNAATLLTRPSNYAVVQLPGRHYPGVVFQGDSLAIHSERAAEVAHLARGTAAEEAANWLSDELNEVVRMYIRVLRDHTIEVPFEYRPPDAPSA